MAKRLRWLPAAPPLTWWMAALKTMLATTAVRGWLAAGFLAAPAGALAASPVPAPAAVATPADRTYENGTIFTADNQHANASALAIRDGIIVYVGNASGLGPYVGPKTTRIDLAGRFVMPGLVDGHLHPLSAGQSLLMCNLNYAALTVARLQQGVQDCLDRTAAREPDGWLEVVNWFQESMQPAGVRTSRATLDALHTKRPVIVRSSFGHTVLANSRALALAGIVKGSPDPTGGKIWRDADGTPSGLLEDAAFAVFDTLIPQPSAQDDVKAASAALAALRQQGVTSFLDAVGMPQDLAAFSALRKAGQLTARAHFAPPIEPSEAATLDAAIARVLALRAKFDDGALTVAPGITVRNAKLFLDGVISAPAMTGAVIDPYRRNSGTPTDPHWVEGTSHGPEVYFPPQALETALVALGRAGIDPHLHADGDAAVRAGLDAVAALRRSVPGVDIRPAIAHDEIVARSDYPRFAALGVIPVLSLQWGKPAGDTLGLTDYFGPERMRILEPAGFLDAAGARIAFGSDWPVDALNEWFAFKVGVTRTNAPDVAPQYRGRLGDDPGLTRDKVLRAATINAAYELHEDRETGSLEVGKFADLIVLDRDPLTVAADDIAATRVLETVVGGSVVYSASAPEAH